jgi:prepilin peptidase CpaA
MTIGTPEFALLGLLALLLLIGAVTDWQRRSIDNWLTATIALTAPLYWWATGLGWWPDIALLAGLALWFPGPVMLRLVIIMSLAGGILTVAMLIRHKFSKSEAPLEIPYGLAISLAGLWAIYERNLNQFG